jgi:hypothetical protein
VRTAENVFFQLDSDWGENISPPSAAKWNDD